MKRHIYKIISCVIIIMMMAQFSGCTKTESAESAPEINNTAAEKNAEAEQAYLDFLGGKTVITTSEKFREDDEEFNFDGLLYGTYSYEELKSAIAELEGNESVTKYTFIDFGQDGVNEFVLRLNNTDPSFLNWTGIIKYNGEGLDLNYYYEDGYRTFSTLYTSGYLQIGGSIGAGGNTATVVEFDKNGFGTDVFTEKQLYGLFAEDIAYDLRKDGSGLSGNYDEISADSQLFVREYMAGDTVKMSVSGWNEDSAVRAGEEALINELVALGAEQISEAEIDKLCSLSPYAADEVNWQEWNSEPSTEDENANSAGDAVSIDYASEELLSQPDSFIEFIAEESEYQEKVVFSAKSTVTDVHILSINLEDVSDAGEISFSSEDLYSLDVLTAEKPLVVGMVFWGDTPNMGISYVDGSGAKHTNAISMSGFDGSLLLTEVNFI